MIVSLESVAFGPASHCTASAVIPFRACHQESAITATPAASPYRLPLSATTSRTPGSRLAAAASKRAGVPPTLGLIATAAYLSPGTRTSIPNTARPLDFSAESSRGVGLPSSVNSASRLSVTREGRCATASPTNSPNRSRDAPDTTTPCSTRHSAMFTPSRAAAAATSDARAEAPASRIGIQQSRMLDEPPVIITPTFRTTFAVIHFTPRTTRPFASG